MNETKYVRFLETGGILTSIFLLIKLKLHFSGFLKENQDSYFIKQK